MKISNSMNRAMSKVNFAINTVTLSVLLAGLVFEALGISLGLMTMHAAVVIIIAATFAGFIAALWHVGYAKFKTALWLQQAAAGI
ncbi:hypothetical protein [Paraburkholderia sp. SIMBA_054]|uniref:hypothetical protein n=1 Tax=Paraburkholderia sp. SIMBA_054 TaxID=3085795 RepID=UPI003979B455